MDQKDREAFTRLSLASKSALAPGNSRSVSLHQAQSNCSAAVAADRARVLIGCYRKGDAGDEEVYAGAIGAVLSSYPESVARRVTDPRTGLPGTSQWLPTVHEVRAACEREMQPQRDDLRRRAQRAHTARICRPGAPQESAERRKQVAEEISARLAGLGDDPRKPKRQYRSLDQLAAEYAANPVTISPALRQSLGLKAGAAE